MPVPPKQAVSHYRGDTLAIKLTCWQDDKKTVPCNFTGATIVSQLRVKADDAQPADTFAVSVTGQVVTLSLTPARDHYSPRCYNLGRAGRLAERWSQRSNHCPG